MRNKREILKEHYSQIARKIGAWAGLVSLIGTMFVAGPASAYGQITSRSTTLGNSKLSASTTYNFTFKPATTGTIKAIKFEICTSPLQSASCTAVTGSSMSTSSTFTTGAPTTAPFTTNWATGTGGAAPSTSAYWIHYTTGTSVTAGTSYTVQLGSIVNPSTANLQYYTRISTYSDDPGTVLVDFGGAAVSTGTEISVNANVQESLVFTVGQTGTCGSISGSSVNIGNNPGTDNVLSSSAATAGTSVMCVNTNALSGYVISYISNQASSNGFTNGTYTIADNSSGATFTSATAGSADFFGINVRSNTGTGGGPTAGADYSGGVAPTSYGAAYGTAGTFGFARGAFTTLVSETTGATADTLYTVTYAAQAGSATAVGAYQVKMNYVATGTF